MSRSTLNLLDGSGTHLAKVAKTLNRLAILFGLTQRIREAEEAYVEALAIRRKLAEANPDTCRAEVAGALNNISNLYLSTERIQEAEVCASEAERIRNPLWLQNSEAHGNLMAMILWTIALVAEANETSAAKSCALARRALAAAHNPVLHSAIRELVDRLCSKQIPPSSADTRHFPFQV